MIGLLVSLRPKQWIKNGLLFMALIFSRSVRDLDLVASTIVAFLAFCGLASTTYLINDVLDLEKDRLHPVKRGRPIASGRVPRQIALSAAAVLLAMSLSLLGSLGVASFAMGLAYLALTTSYSLALKHMVIVDILAVSAGFVLRAAAGAVVIGVPISPWLYVCTLLGALFISIGKRRHELVLLQASASDHRRILEQYSVPLLDQMLSMVSAATVITYSLYTFSADNLPRNHAMMLTIPFVLYALFRYLYLIHVREVGGSPEEVLLSDRPLLLAIAGWMVASAAILYLVKVA